MFLKHIQTGDLVSVQDFHVLVDPSQPEVAVRFQAGEEEGDVMTMTKDSLRFPSNEILPKCWLDTHYRMTFS